MVAQTVTGTRTRSLENPTTVLVGVILVPPLERLLLVVPSARYQESPSFPISTAIVRSFVRRFPVAFGFSRSDLLLCSLVARYATQMRAHDRGETPIYPRASRWIPRHGFTLAFVRRAITTGSSSIRFSPIVRLLPSKPRTVKLVALYGSTTPLRLP